MIKMFEPLFPIQKPDLFALYNAAVQSFWTVNEVDLEKDELDKLSEVERSIVSKILSFFAASDIIVCENIMQSLYRDCVYAEAKQFYSIQMGMESVHTHMYSLLIERYYGCGETAKTLFDGIETNEHIRNKAEFCMKYMLPDMPMSQRLVAYAAVEGIFFCSSFATIYYFKKRGVLPGLTFSNELIARDESLHAQFSCMLYKQQVHDKILTALTQEIVVQIIEDACDHETRFVSDVLKDPVLGFNCEEMTQYVKYMGDYLLVMLGFGKFYNVPNPFDWMDLQALQSKANFFETRVSEYSKPKSKRIFSLDEDF